ncbi:CpsD/CapB family tyrosine-protein kinase [Romboutsia sp.]|uniref:CpsD/CapB family tyrosine-protein kinase n=1 Tax=Romboutsia sp. TaxID=1965302 RepID=UPI003F2CDCCD
MQKLISLKKNKSPILESYREIRTNIEHYNAEKKIKTILITSTSNREGKTIVASNLAISFAYINKKVLIIDCDLRKPSIYEYFDVINEQGIIDILLDKNKIEECIKKTNIDNLDILTTGSIPINPPELLSSPKIKEIIENVKNIYDYIFIDTSPIGCVIDANIIVEHTDGVIFVVSSNEINRSEIKIAEEKLKNIGANVIGVILNKYKFKKGEYIKYSYK